MPPAGNMTNLTNMTKQTNMTNQTDEGKPLSTKIEAGVNDESKIFLVNCIWNGLSL